jgi:hypothetical protein
LIARVVIPEKEPELKTAHVSANRSSKAWFPILVALVLVLGAGRTARAQVTPAAGYTPPDDTPSIKIGAVIFADYTYQQQPTGKDADGNVINPSSFNVARTYINVTGNISHIVAFRITPDVTRFSQAGNSLDGSMTYRIKYAYAQINLDDWLPKGSWVRFGIQQTPFIDSVEGIYRYRFQGTIYFEREGYQASADAGVSFRAPLPNNYGDFQVGYYNGEGYSKAETNDQKALMVRVGFRPLPRHPVMKGWRLQGFYTSDNYQQNAPRTRAVFNTTFEHPYVNMGFDYIDTHDQTSAKPGSQNQHGQGWSFWATPRKVFPNGSSIEALLRYDHTDPTKDVTVVGGSPLTIPGVNKRTIGGIAYWFPHQGSVSYALLLDVENMTFADFVPSKPVQQKIFLHTLISF